METIKLFLNLISGEVSTKEDKLFSIPLGIYNDLVVIPKESLKGLFVYIPVSNSKHINMEKFAILSYETERDIFNIILCKIEDLHKTITTLEENEFQEIQDPDKIINQDIWTYEENEYKKKTLHILINGYQRGIDYLKFIDTRRYKFKKQFEIWKNPDCLENSSLIRRNLGLFYDLQNKKWLTILMKNCLIINVSNEDPFLSLPQGEIPWHKHWRKMNNLTIFKEVKGEIVTIREEVKNNGNNKILRGYEQKFKSILSMAKLLVGNKNNQAA